MLKSMMGGAVTAVIAGTLVAALGGQSSYRITVSLDDTTRGDFDVVGTTLGNATAGSEVPRAVRRLASGAAGELALLANQRIADGMLKLDDGRLVPLGPDDEVYVSVVGEPTVEYTDASGLVQTAAQKSIVIIPGECGSDKCPMRPSTIIVIAGGECRKTLLFAGRPVVLSCGPI